MAQMTTLIDSKLVERFKEKIKHEDDRAKELMAAGLLADFGEYRHAGGYRRGLADALKLLDEATDEIMRE